MTPLITPHALHRLLGRSDLVVLDASAPLPGEAADLEQGFLERHISGARRFRLEVFSDPEGDLPHMVPSQARFARLAGALGIGNDSHVVFYDQAGLIAAARGWWMLGLFGHDRVQVLDGGLPAWTAEDLPVETGEASPLVARPFTPRLRAERLVGLGDMIAIAAGARRAVVIDARSRARFEGSAPETRAGLPSGHIPGSASLPYGDVLDVDKRMLPVSALRARLGEAGVDGSLPVVTSCGSGLTASVLSLALGVAGYAPGALFDGSWTEWASHPELPRIGSAS